MKSRIQGSSCVYHFTMRSTHSLKYVEVKIGEEIEGVDTHTGEQKSSFF